MPKSIILLLVSVLVFSSVFAEEELSVFHQQGYVSGPAPIGKESLYAIKAPMPSIVSKYIGFSLGGGLIDTKPKISIHEYGTLIGEENNKDRGAIHSMFGVYAGYGRNFTNFYIGGELGAFYNFLKKSIKDEVADNHNIDMTFKRPILVALDIIPGYINEGRDFLLYGRAGIGASWFNYKLKDSFENFSENINRVNFSYRLGLGVEFFMSSTFGLRVEYIYNRFDAKRVTSYSSLKTYRYKYEYDIGKGGIHTVNLGLSIHL